ncbi:MAG: lactonase family protein [Burkholderiales bacterium]
MTRFTRGWKNLITNGLLAMTIALVGAVNPAVADSNEKAIRAVYALSNTTAGNEVIVFRRSADGGLTPAGRVATHGLGSGGGLGNQGALALSRNGEWLFAVNAGSNDISVLAVRQDGLRLVSRIGSGGIRPVSLTLHGDILYVLNAGGTNNVTGFTIGDHGTLSPIPGSTKPLSAASTAPAQVQFDPEGELLVVTEKATNKIVLYKVEDGVADGPLVRDSVGATPFGFAFDKRGTLIVSEAFGGAPNRSALSSYKIPDDTTVLQLVSGSVGTNQTAACWVVITKNGRFAYTTNTGSGTVSGYRIGKDGELRLLNADGRTAVIGAGSGPTDAALSTNSRFLYVLNPGIGSVSGFRVEADGSLSSVGNATGIPASATGLVAQ